MTMLLNSIKKKSAGLIAKLHGMTPEDEEKKTVLPIAQKDGQRSYRMDGRTVTVVR